MNPRIAMLLKMSNIPGVILTKKEQAELDAWKATLVEVKPKKRTARKTTRRKKTNEVKPEEKEIGEIEES